jgi:hypothetical protein
MENNKKVNKSITAEEAQPLFDLLREWNSHQIDRLKALLKASDGSAPASSISKPKP